MEKTPNIDLLERRIKNPVLSSSIERIKISVEELSSKFDIIKYFPDHGISHSDHVAKYILDLISLYKSNEKFSEIEYYILTASACLHDIGMHCDLAKYPWIKERAEKFGGWFDIDFSGEYSLDLSPQQQEVIRVNHQFLTAAWIDFSYNNEDGNKKTELDEAIRTIPPQYVKEIKDICMYHSKQDFLECEERLECEPGRKRLLAAILRFADELDIDWGRVIGTSYNSFNIPPINKKYWCLHDHTHVGIDKKSNSYSIKITINSKDSDLKEQIKRLYIDKFEEKNKEINRYLTQNNIPIVPSKESAVINNDYYDEMPRDVRRSIIEQYLVDSNPSILFLKPGERVTGVCRKRKSHAKFNYCLLYLKYFNYKHKKSYIYDEKIIYIPYDLYGREISDKKIEILSPISILYDGINYKINLIKREEDFDGPRFMEIGEKIEGTLYWVKQDHPEELYIASINDDKIYMERDLGIKISKYYWRKIMKKAYTPVMCFISLFRKDEKIYDAYDEECHEIK